MRLTVIALLAGGGMGFVVGWFCRFLYHDDYTTGYNDGWHEYARQTMLPNQTPQNPNL
jgi:hypothetical protein